MYPLPRLRHTLPSSAPAHGPARCTPAFIVSKNNNNNNNPQENGGPPNQPAAQQGQPLYGSPGSASGTGTGTGTSNPQGAPGAGATPPLPPQRPPAEYTLAGVLHYLQSEWRCYERDRNGWEIERAERRVKMLEYALRQERSKYLVRSSAAAGSGSPRPNSATVGTPPVGGLPAAILAKHPPVHVDKASSSGRSSPVARSEDFGKDVFGAGNAATFPASQHTHSADPPIDIRNHFPDYTGDPHSFDDVWYHFRDAFLEIAASAHYPATLSTVTPSREVYVHPTVAVDRLSRLGPFFGT
ncbi:unnamed protein product [Tilletia controversa]|uniref:Striatin N-terminal domain-containing protein n=1 Tax=Tilletia controversa TaxID=13291 RepID=A0A8X7N0N3_9BASI|nr:hypothetical protein CF328_g1702 [Tilletia controversa]KAE8254269.1 hypothetical protein A4X06_0g979 [Tilletia controversa]CAD6929277.1 unnamed protein product [Tilletia controversa]CAD6950510.1 unnamed protein product [Tilletia controversa]CAD6969628.1 unnamed protein product [Tilletia controversa]